MVTRIFERGQGAQHVIHQRETGRPTTEIQVDRLGQRAMVADQQIDDLLESASAGVGAHQTGAGECAFLPG
ncbi:hypothetical protein D3C84_1034450 [compost metagenome]